MMGQPMVPTHVDPCPSKLASAATDRPLAASTPSDMVGHPMIPAHTASSSAVMNALVVSDCPSQTSSVPNFHPTVTRSKDGTRKPKILSTTQHPLPTALTAIKSKPKPTCFSLAVKSLEWQAAMTREFDTLQFNGT